jgi:hypothetical protein
LNASLNWILAVCTIISTAIAVWQYRRARRDKDKFASALLAVQRDIEEGLSVVSYHKESAIDTKTTMGMLAELLRIQENHIAPLVANLTSDKRINLIEGKDKVLTTMLYQVDRASGYFYAVGGKMRESVYANALTLMLKKKKLPYKRIINNPHIREELHQHIREMWKGSADNNYLEFYHIMHGSNLTVTKENVFIGLADSRVKYLNWGLFIRDASLAQDFTNYVLTLIASDKAYRIRNLEEVDRLCKICHPELHPE